MKAATLSFREADALPDDFLVTLFTGLTQALRGGCLVDHRAVGVDGNLADAWAGQQGFDDPHIERTAGKRPVVLAGHALAVVELAAGAGGPARSTVTKNRFQNS